MDGRQTAVVVEGYELHIHELFSNNSLLMICNNRQVRGRHVVLFTSSCSRPDFWTTQADVSAAGTSPYNSEALISLAENDARHIAFILTAMSGKQIKVTHTHTHTVCQAAKQQQK